jgi:hypothetical protein
MLLMRPARNLRLGTKERNDPASSFDVDRLYARWTLQTERINWPSLSLTLSI